MKQLRHRLPPLPWLVAGALFVAATLIGATLFFPYRTLQSRVEAEAAARGVRLEIADLAPALPWGATATTLRLAPSSGTLPPLTIDRLTLRPALLPLLAGRIVLRVDARLAGGGIAGELTRGGGYDLTGHGVELRLPLYRGSGGTVVGKLRSATLRGALPPRPDTSTRIELVVDELRLEGFSAGAAPLPLGTLTLRLNGNGSALRCDTLELSGGKIAASGGGSLNLAAPLQRSTLNLALRLRPAPDLDPSLAALLAALVPPGADGSATLRLGGTLAAPRKL